MSTKTTPIPVLTTRQISNFYKKVNSGKPNECWHWIGSIAHNGYGRYSINRQIFGPHRIAYFLHYKQDPGPLLVCHQCDCRHCCNPHHLFLGLHQDNMDDAKQKGRMHNGEKAYNAKFTQKLVNEIRQQYLHGDLTVSKAKKLYGPGAVDMLTNATWYDPHYHYFSKYIKLSIEAAKQIRILYQTTNISKRELAKQFGVTPANIRFVLANKIWLN